MHQQRVVMGLIGVVLFVGGCASADRVATSRETTIGANGTSVYRLEWTSDAYGRRVVDHPRPDREFQQNCYDKVVVGQAVPVDCLTLRVLHDETGALARNQWLTYGLSAVMAAGLALFAIRRIDWMPGVAPATEHLESAGSTGTHNAAVELMRSVESEKSALGGVAVMGHDLQHPGWAGMGAGMLALAVLTALVGFGTSVSWGLVTAALMFVGVGSVAILLVIGALTGRSNMDPLIRRLFFLGGFIVVVLVVSLIGLGLWWPLYWLNGVDWPG